MPFYFPRFTIWFPVGPVTLPITVDIDVLSDASVNAKANAKATAGCYGNIGLEVGMEYHSGSTKPILKPEYSFGLHPVTLETFGSMEAQGSVYPELQLRLFNFMGPNERFEYGFVVRVGELPYCEYAHSGESIRSRGAYEKQVFHWNSSVSLLI